MSEKDNMKGVNGYMQGVVGADGSFFKAVIQQYVFDHDVELSDSTEFGDGKGYHDEVTQEFGSGQIAGKVYSNKILGLGNLGTASGTMSLILDDTAHDGSGTSGVWGTVLLRGFRIQGRAAGGNFMFTSQYRFQGVPVPFGNLDKASA